MADTVASNIYQGQQYISAENILDYLYSTLKHLLNVVCFFFIN